MAKAKKLKSGSWNVLVYSHTDADGKRKYESFTASTKKEAEYMAAEFKMERERKRDAGRLLLGEAIDQYIKSKEQVLSPATIQGYRKIRNQNFQSIMDIPLRRIDETTLQRAVIAEMSRPNGRGGHLSAKSVKNAYGLISAVLSRHFPDRVFRVDLPKSPRRIRTLPEPRDIYAAVHGDKIELAVLLAMWLSLTMSEIRGLTKSKSVDGDYITIREVVVVVDGLDVRKPCGKTTTRNRRLRMPGPIRELIDQVDGDVIVPYSPSVLLKGLKRCLKKSDIPDISFHDLRHISATVMASLQIPDTYAQARGGWKTDSIMKTVYTETFDSGRKAADRKIDEYFGKFVES